jgi:hypothetical protein
MRASLSKQPLRRRRETRMTVVSISDGAKILGEIDGSIYDSPPSIYSCRPPTGIAIEALAM